MKKGNKMELMLFIGSVALVVLTGWLYFEKSTADYLAIRERMDSLDTMIVAIENDISDMGNVQPQTLNVVMKEPIRVIYRHAAGKPALPPLPGNISKLKQQMDGLSK